MQNMDNLEMFFLYNCPERVVQVLAVMAVGLSEDECCYIGLGSPLRENRTSFGSNDCWFVRG
jgi:hypothetical protein